MVQYHLGDLLGDQGQGPDGRQLHVLFGVIEEGHQLQERTVDQGLRAFFGESDQEDRKGTDAGLPVLPILMVNGLLGEGKDLALELSGTVVEDRLQSGGCGFADPVALLVMFIHEADILEEGIHKLFREGARDEASHVGVGLNALLLFGEGAPKLHGQPTGLFLFGVLENRE